MPIDALLGNILGASFDMEGGCAYDSGCLCPWDDSVLCPSFDCEEDAQDHPYSSWYTNKNGQVSLAVLAEQ
jgi:hypothetical protein